MEYSCKEPHFVMEIQLRRQYPDIPPAWEFYAIFKHESAARAVALILQAHGTKYRLTPRDYL